MPEIILRAENLKKRYGRTVAVDGVSLEVARGEVIAVIGANGAGKTSLLYLLGGVIFPSGGDVEVFGMHRWKQNYEIRKRSTVLAAEPITGASPTPYEYNRFLGQIYGVPYDVFRVRLAELVKEFEFDKHLKRRWEELSLGLAKKGVLIGALLPDAELRILDEPFAGGIDPPAMEALYRRIDNARQRGETIIFSTQVLDQAEDAATRIIIMEGGQVITDGAPHDLMEQVGINPGEPRALAKTMAALREKAGKADGG